MVGTRPTRSPAVLAWLVVLPILVTTVLLSWHSLGDRDVWLHLRAGRDILDTGRVPSVNTYSFTAPEHPWVNHEWLFQVALTATGPVAGAREPTVSGWHLLRATLSLALALVLLGGDGGWDRLRGRTPRREILAIGVAITGGLGLLWTRLILRPELVSYILLAVVLRGIEQVLAPATAPPPPSSVRARHPVARVLRHPLSTVTAATWLWAQVHGFAGVTPSLWLLVALATLLAPLLRAGSGTRLPRGRMARTAGTGLLLSLLALLVTPNGVSGLLYPLRALEQFGADGPALNRIISELVPLLETRDALGTTLTLFRVSLVWSLGWIVLQWGRVRLSRVLLLLLAVPVALGSQRGLGFYAVALVLLHTGTSGPLRLPVPRPWLSRPRLGSAVALVSALLLVAVHGFFWPRLVDDTFYLGEGVARRFGGGLTPAEFPVHAAAWLRGSGAGRVVANVDAAGFLLANSPARLAVDGRTEAFPPAVWRAYEELRAGGDRTRTQVARWRPDALCLTLGGSFRRVGSEMLAAPDWRLVAADAAALVFVPGRRDTLATVLRAAADDLERRATVGTTRTRHADLWHAAARLWETAGEPAAAAAALETGLAARPDHPVLNHNLGLNLMAAGRFEAARSRFRAALAVNPRLAGSAVNAGVCAARLDRPATAVEDFRRAVRIDPTRFIAWANLSTLLRQQGDRAGALDATLRALALRPGDERLRARAHELRRPAASP